jgi:hypothetical protein
MSKVYQKVTASDIEFKKPNEMAVGEVIEGRYVEAKKIGKFDKFTYLIETEAGTTIGLNEAGQLAKLMAKVPVGSDVRITYQGMAVIKSGQWKGSEAHTFEVESAAASTDGDDSL